MKGERVIRREWNLRKLSYLNMASKQPLFRQYTYISEQTKVHKSLLTVEFSYFTSWLPAKISVFISDNKQHNSGFTNSRPLPLAGHLPHSVYWLLVMKAGNHKKLPGWFTGGRFIINTSSRPQTGWPTQKKYQPNPLLCKMTYSLSIRSGTPALFGERLIV